MLTFALLMLFQPRFEVASVKPASPEAGGMTRIRNPPGGRIEVTNMPLKELIVFAWRIQPYQIVGGPAWISSERYDVEAKAESAPKPGEMQAMLQGLLAERFQLVTHQETKELPVYALVLARKD